MPTRAEHLSQAVLNEAFCDEVLSLGAGKSQYFSWAVVSLFYAVVHYGRAFAFDKGVTIASHVRFEDSWRTNCGDADLWVFYRQLKDESEAARYDALRYSSEQVETIRTNYFEPFRAGMKALLGLQ